jgi:hypothetical protein
MLEDGTWANAGVGETRGGPATRVPAADMIRPRRGVKPKSRQAGRQPILAMSASEISKLE